MLYFLRQKRHNDYSSTLCFCRLACRYWFRVWLFRFTTFRPFGSSATMRAFCNDATIAVLEKSVWFRCSNMWLPWVVFCSEAGILPCSVPYGHTSVVFLAFCALRQTYQFRWASTSWFPLPHLDRSSGFRYARLFPTWLSRRRVLCLLRPRQNVVQWTPGKTKPTPLLPWCLDDDQLWQDPHRFGGDYAEKGEEASVDKLKTNLTQNFSS